MFMFNYSVIPTATHLRHTRACPRSAGGGLRYLAVTSTKVCAEHGEIAAAERGNDGEKHPGAS